jgi:uroporphyrin-III C-methyltransferase
MGTERAKIRGRAILIGAGPGDPDLLTVRAARALGEADLVLYDALVDPRVLELAPRAARFFVGKRAGRTAIAQSTIHALMLRAARRGRTVVRLKSGDPFVLGRGGEEALFCEEHGVPCDVVPGLTSAIAGPASVGIPVTHREVSPGFLVLSAAPSAHYQAILPRIPPGSVTVVLLMALGSRASIAAFLEGAGWPADLPAAIVVGATSAREWSWTGRLDELANATVPDDRGDLPGLLVLGPVVGLADAIRRARPSDRHEESSLSINEEEEAPWQRLQAP